MLAFSRKTAFGSRNGLDVHGIARKPARRLTSLRAKSFGCSLAMCPSWSTPLIWPTDAARSALRHPGQAKREPGSQKDWRFNLLRSRIRLCLSGKTAAAIRWLVRRTLLSSTPALRPTELSCIHLYPHPQIANSFKGRLTWPSRNISLAGLGPRALYCNTASDSLAAGRASLRSAILWAISSTTSHGVYSMEVLRSVGPPVRNMMKRMSCRSRQV